MYWLGTTFYEKVFQCSKCLKKFFCIVPIQTFQDNRTKTKTKQSALQAAQRRTGYNTPCTPLSFVENNTLELINPTSISGHTESMASKVLFSFDNADDGNLMMMS